MPAAAPGAHQEPGIYEVVISYQEPTYAEYAGLPLKTYGGTFRVSASNADDAKARAVAQFEQAQRASSVGWTREIVDITCRRVS